MTLPNLFSRRKRQALGKSVDVYQYEKCPSKLRIQLTQIIKEGNDRFSGCYDYEGIYQDAVILLRKELGVHKLHNEYDYYLEFTNWFLTCSSIDELLDGLEVAIGLISYNDSRFSDGRVIAEVVSEINARCLEAGFGFQIEGGHAIQINSQFIHSEVVVPALSLLSSPEYTAANDEFLQAHEEYRTGNYEDCIHDCCNAFESVLKIILTKKNWSFGATDTASKLLAVAFSNDLIPSHMQNEFTGLRTILESGVPTVRNKNAGHGAGVNPRNVPSYIAAFQLHQTAAAIVMLVEAAK